MRTATRLALLLAIGLVGPGCAAHAPAPAPARGAAEPQAFPARFSVAGEAPSDDRWWTAFGDPVLDRLVETALCGNLTPAGGAGAGDRGRRPGPTRRGAA